MKSLLYADQALSENQLDILDGLLEFAEEMNSLSSVIKHNKSSGLYEDITEMSNPLNNLTKVSDWALKLVATSDINLYLQRP